MMKLLFTTLSLMPVVYGTVLVKLSKDTDGGGNDAAIGTEIIERVGTCEPHYSGKNKPDYYQKWNCETAGKVKLEKYKDCTCKTPMPCDQCEMNDGETREGFQYNCDNSKVISGYVFETFYTASGCTNTFQACKVSASAVDVCMKGNGEGAAGSTATGSRKVVKEGSQYKTKVYSDMACNNAVEDSSTANLETCQVSGSIDKCGDGSASGTHFKSKYYADSVDATAANTPEVCNAKWSVGLDKASKMKEKFSLKKDAVANENNMAEKKKKLIAYESDVATEMKEQAKGLKTRDEFKTFAQKTYEDIKDSKYQDTDDSDKWVYPEVKCDSADIMDETTRNKLKFLPTKKFKMGGKVRPQKNIGLAKTYKADAETFGSDDYYTPLEVGDSVCFTCKAKDVCFTQKSADNVEVEDVTTSNKVIKTTGDIYRVHMCPKQFAIGSVATTDTEESSASAASSRLALSYMAVSLAFVFAAFL